MASPTTRGPVLPQPTDSVISVLTPLFEKGIEFIAETWASVRDQELPAGMELEWVVQEDADDPVLESFIAELTDRDRRVRYCANGRHRGQAVTRNMAFQRSRGTRVYALDQDDVLLPGTLAALAACLDAHPNVMWVTGHVQRLFDDGHVELRMDPIEDGPLPAGHLLELFDQGITTAFYPTATMFRRHALHVLGGWPAVVAAEDAELQLAMGAAFDGYRIDHLLLSRRKWDGQAVSADWYAGPDLEAITTRGARANAINAARRAGMF